MPKSRLELPQFGGQVGAFALVGGGWIENGVGGLDGQSAVIRERFGERDGLAGMLPGAEIAAERVVRRGNVGVAGFKGRGGEVAEAGVASARVVPAFDPAKDAFAGGVAGGKAAAVDVLA